jgi:hypothetical protein
VAGRLSHSDQETLNDAVVSAVKRDLPGGGFAWQKQPGGSIAQLMAATLAHWSLLTFAPAARPKPPTPPPLAEPDRGGHDGALDLMTAPF